MVKINLIAIKIYEPIQIPKNVKKPVSIYFVSPHIVNWVINYIFA